MSKFHPFYHVCNHQHLNRLKQKKSDNPLSFWNLCQWANYKMVVRGRVAGHRFCAQTWMSEDPLPGHRTSSTPGTAVGAAAEWPWPASPGCPPPAGAPGPGCPFPRCAAAVAASSLARAASAAQPSDWTSRQRETSSANTHSEQPCRHDNLSIQRSVQPSLALFPLPKAFTQNIQPPKSNQAGEREDGGKKVSLLPRSEYNIWLALPPSHLSCKSYRPRISHSFLSNRSLFACSVVGT